MRRVNDPFVIHPRSGAEIGRSVVIRDLALGDEKYPPLAAAEVAAALKQAGIKFTDQTVRTQVRELQAMLPEERRPAASPTRPRKPKAMQQIDTDRWSEMPDGEPGPLPIP